MSVLTDRKIKEEIFNQKITIGGFREDHLNPNSYDLTLAPTCKIFHPRAIKGTNISASFNSTQMMEYFEWADSVTNNRDWELDVKNKSIPTFEFIIPKEGFVLQPKHLYLYSCNEIIGVKGDVCATVMGKSSLGRLGLDIHVCAGFIDTGFLGSLVLEMRTIYPLKIYPNMKICQIKYEYISGLCEKDYSEKTASKYMNQEGVQISKMNENFKGLDDDIKIGPSNWLTHD